MSKCKELKMQVQQLEFKLKCARKKLEYTQEVLAETEIKLENTDMWKRVYQGRYEYYLQENEELRKVNAELKKKNRDLEISLKAFKAIINALKRKVG